MHTASISIQSDGVQVCITSLSGQDKGALTLAGEATIRQMEMVVKDMYQWTTVSFFKDDGHEIDEAAYVKNHNRLTMRARIPRFPMRKLDAAQQPDSTLPEVLGLRVEPRDATCIPPGPAADKKRGQKSHGFGNPNPSIVVPVPRPPRGRGECT